MPQEYRPLKAGEKIQEGDEYFMDGVCEWVKCHHTIGKTVTLRKYRRPICNVANEEHPYGSGEHDVVLDAIKEHIEGN